MVPSNQDRASHDSVHPCQGFACHPTLDEMQNQHLAGMGKLLHTIKSEMLLSTEPSIEKHQNHDQCLYATSSINSNLNLRGVSNVNGSLMAWHEVSQRGEQADSCGTFSTTLEEFLARATIVNYECQRKAVVVDSRSLVEEDPDRVVQQRAELLHYQLGTAKEAQQMKTSMFETSMPMFNDAVLGEYIESNQKCASLMPVSPVSIRKSTLADTQATGILEMKQSDGQLDENYERKQKRMIKNRESAARSRAKKQAYINHLEKEVHELKRKNECLKRKNVVDSVTRLPNNSSKKKCRLQKYKSI